MLCGYLQEFNGRMVPCGQCMNCRINKKRMWTGRILLEAAYSPAESTFLTLTYNPEHVPENFSLDPSDLHRFINRLRHRSGLGSFRFFAVGEYGDENQRPHYHAAIFANPPEIVEEQAKRCWTDKNGESLGFISAGSIEQASASYIAGYCTKKMTSKDDERLDGRYQEFTRMSKFPPLGAAGVHHILDMLHTRTGAAAVAKNEDVPKNFTTGGKTYPLGSYWVNYLREKMGITNPPVKASWQLDWDKLAPELQNAEKIATKLWRGHKKGRQTRNPIPAYTTAELEQNRIRLNAGRP